MASVSGLRETCERTSRLRKELGLHLNGDIVGAETAPDRYGLWRNRISWPKSRRRVAGAVPSYADMATDPDFKTKYVTRLSAI
jgi:hypothetical protein